MTAAGDRREDLEALLWQEKIPAPLVELILAAADAYAKAFRPRGPRKPPVPTAGGPAAVHYAPAGSGHAACQPGREWTVRGSREICGFTFGHNETAY